MYTLITGASRGIGAAFARRLAADGHSLILVARDGAQLATLKEELGHHYAVPIELWVADLSHPGSAEALHAHCQQSGWVVSRLINNAGFGRFGDFHSHPAATYAAMLQLNVTTPVLLAHYFLACQPAHTPYQPHIPQYRRLLRPFWANPHDARLLPHY